MKDSATSTLHSHCKAFQIEDDSGKAGKQGDPTKINQQLWSESWVLRFSLAGKSVYFIVVDRFARSGEQVPIDQRLTHPETLHLKDSSHLHAHIFRTKPKDWNMVACSGTLQPLISSDIVERDWCCFQNKAYAGLQHNLLRLGRWLDEQHWRRLLRGYPQWHHKSPGLYWGAKHARLHVAIELAAFIDARKFSTGTLAAKRQWWQTLMTHDSYYDNDTVTVSFVIFFGLPSPVWLDLGFVQGMGFDCIWITPVVDSNGFMGYDAENIFEIESHFGSKDLRDCKAGSLPCCASIMILSYMNWY